MSEARAQAVPPVISVVGRKNSGKTTLVVALVAELTRRGLRVATLKHSHHDFDIDVPGKDSWRHFHEGRAEAVLLTSPHRTALVMRTPDADADPVALIDRFFAGSGYDLVVVEAFKHVPFRRIEIHRAAVHDSPLYQEQDALRERYLAITTDVPDALSAHCAVIPLDGTAGSHVALLADLVEAQLGPRWTAARHAAIAAAPGTAAAAVSAAPAAGRCPPSASGAGSGRSGDPARRRTRRGSA